MAFEALLGGVHFHAQILHACEDRIEAAEVSPRVVCHDPGQGCFADAGRTMQDQVADAVGLDGAPEETPLGKDPLLAFEFLQGARTHAVGQGGLLPSPLFTLISEEVLAQRSCIDGPNRTPLARYLQLHGFHHIIGLPV